MKHYVVTGGAGFIGSALVRALLARGDGHVRVIDNLLTGHEKNLDEVRPRIAFDHCDIRDYDAVAAAVSNADNCRSTLLEWRGGVEATPTNM